MPSRITLKILDKRQNQHNILKVVINFTREKPRIHLLINIKDKNTNIIITN